MSIDTIHNKNASILLPAYLVPNMGSIGNTSI